LVDFAVSGKSSAAVSSAEQKVQANEALRACRTSGSLCYTSKVIAWKETGSVVSGFGPSSARVPSLNHPHCGFRRATDRGLGF